MTHRRFTLLAEGSSDAALLPILKWLWGRHRPEESVEGNFADLTAIVQSHSLDDRIAPALDLFPCDVLFIHRDADRESISTREQEIQAAITECRAVPPAVFVVPVRMTEAWMLFDEPAIRKAAGNPNGSMKLPLPPLRKTESRPNPKADLHKAIRTASGLTASRLARFNAPRACRLVTEFISDFSPLRHLRSFARLEEQFSNLSLK